MKNIRKHDGYIVTIPPIVVDTKEEAAELIEAYGGEMAPCTNLEVLSPRELSEISDECFAGSVVR